MPNSTLPSTPSKDLTSQDSTQIVMAKGNHTINPVSMYFLNGTEPPASVDDTIRNRTGLQSPQRMMEVVLRSAWPPQAWVQPPQWSRAPKPRYRLRRVP